MDGKGNHMDGKGGIPDGTGGVPLLSPPGSSTEGRQRECGDSKGVSLRILRDAKCGMRIKCAMWK
eukprot:1190110-Prorocentrum_minimum.AAC.3